MKLAFILIIFAPLFVRAQEIRKFRANGIQLYSFELKKWSNLIECDLLVTFKDKRVIIYTEKVQEFDILNKNDIKDDEGTTSELECIDSTGKRCKLYFMSDKNGIFIAMSKSYPESFIMYRITEL